MNALRAKLDAPRRWVRAFWTRLRGSRLSPIRVALSVAVGLGIAAIPLYGTHWALVLVVCWPLRLDAALAFAATMISNPFTLPFLLLFELELGAVLVGDGGFELSRLVAGEDLNEAALQLLVGASILAFSAAIVGTLFVWFAVRAWRQRAAAREPV